MNILRKPVTDAELECLRERNERRAKAHIEELGNRWLLANPCQRLPAAKQPVLSAYWGASR